MIALKQGPNRTFADRLIYNFLFFALPLVLLELIGIPREAWGLVLMIAVPTTLAGVFLATILEHAFMGWLKKRGAAGDDGSNDA